MAYFTCSCLFHYWTSTNRSLTNKLSDTNFAIAPYSITGIPVTFKIGCKPTKEYGFSYVPVILRFYIPDPDYNVFDRWAFFHREKDYFYIMRFLSIRHVSDIYNDIKKTSEYIGPMQHQLVPSGVETEPGMQLPP